MNYPSIESKSPDLLFFLNELNLPFTNLEEQTFRDLEAYEETLAPNESFFVYNLLDNQIDHCFGFENLLGAEVKNIDLEMILNSIFKEDRRDIEFIVSEAVGQIVNLKIPVGHCYLSLSFRMNNQRGESVHIISSNVIYSVNKNGNPVSILIKYSQVSFIKAPIIAQYWVDVKHIDSVAIENGLSLLNESVLTRRERQVAKLIIKGNSSSQIADILNISQHTVIAHRKNIFNKCDCHSANELEIYCVKNRVIL